jgi:hypothetical protein
VIGLTISIQGSFFQLEDYLRLLENLERLVIIDGITISTTSGTSESSSSDGTTLSVTLTGRMFTRAAPTTTDGSTPPPTDGTTTTTVPGTETTTTTAPGSATGGT